MTKAALWVALFLPITDAGATEVLRIGGTGAALGTMQELGHAFAAQTPGFTIEVLPSLGSSGGVRALLEGAIDLAVTARPLNETEAAHPVQAAAFARTPFVLVSSHARPDALRSDALAGIFADPDATWSDGTPVRLILRPESETDSRMLAAHFVGMAEALATARLRPELPVAATDQDNLRLAGSMAGSLTAATLTQVITENEEDRLLVVPLDGRVPRLADLESGAYPLSKTLYLVSRDDSEPIVEAFVAFVRSPAGTDVLQATGNLAVP